MNNKDINTHEYDDIINLIRPVSRTKKQMSIHDRAAQFSPFAAVSGHDLAIKETARLTEKKVELDENAKTLLDEKLRLIQDQIDQHNNIEITFYKPDELKSGGHYHTLIDKVKKINEYDGHLLMQEGSIISIEDILDIQGDMFTDL